MRQTLWANEPAALWAEGYPIGNGRLGGMVLGKPHQERVALNHDRLWRRFWRYQKHETAAIFPQYQQLCLEERWDEAGALIADKMAPSGRCLYVNPFVPLGDLGIYQFYKPDEAALQYRRELDLEQGLVRLRYQIGGVMYEREYFASWPAGVIVVHLRASRAGCVSGEFSLYRLLDRECQMSGWATMDEAVMEGRFEEGVEFAAALRVLRRGGRFTYGNREYLEPMGTAPEKNLGGFTFGFRDCPHPEKAAGVSTCVDSADEVTLLIKMTTGHEAGSGAAKYCRSCLEQINADYQALKAEHIADYQALYKRVAFSLHQSSKVYEDVSLPQRVDKCHAAAKNDDIILQEQAFHLARYLGIAAGRDARSGEPFKAPMNLQGLWNEDPRPAWDCDYHLDLNVQMCYWGLGMVNQAEFGKPLVNWAFSLLEQAKAAAQDMYGLPGAYYNAVCDSENLGNHDDLFMLASGTNAWLTQTLWQVWDYTQDKDMLKNKLYPILREIGRFYEHFLQEDQQGRLLTAPSGSPENQPRGRKIASILSVTSTFDLEVIRELFEHLRTAYDLLGQSDDSRAAWDVLLKKLPLPTLNTEGRMLEWLDKEYETLDPGHRHRSHFVGICPGTRISVEDTPQYAEGVRRSLALRHSFGGKGSCTLDLASDAYIFARLYQPQEALEKVNALIIHHAMGNLLLCLCDWRPESGLNWFGDRRVFQIEASFGLMAAMTQMLLQDHGGLIRLLPALPREWADGSVSGLCARGGFEIAMTWKQGKLTHAQVISQRGGRCRVQVMTGQPLCGILYDGRRETAALTQGGYEFDTREQGIYELIF